MVSSLINLCLRWRYISSRIAVVHIIGLGKSNALYTSHTCTLCDNVIAQCETVLQIICRLMIVNKQSLIILQLVHIFGDLISWQWGHYFKRVCFTLYGLSLRGYFDNASIKMKIHITFTKSYSQLKCAKCIWKEYCSKWSQTQHQSNSYARMK